MSDPYFVLLSKFGSEKPCQEIQGLVFALVGWGGQGRTQRAQNTQCTICRQHGDSHEAQQGPFIINRGNNEKSTLVDAGCLFPRRSQPMLISSSLQLPHPPCPPQLQWSVFIGCCRCSEAETGKARPLNAKLAASLVGPPPQSAHACSSERGKVGWGTDRGPANQQMRPAKLTEKVVEGERGGRGDEGMK